MSKLIYNCGCQFEVQDGQDKEILCKDPISDIPSGKIDLNIYDVPLNCKRTWDLYESGNMGGIFQLEKPLGKQWVKKVKPRGETKIAQLEELSALISILRPGTIKVLSGDPPKSMAQRYVDRKFCRELIDDFGISELREILKDTLGILLYQENSLNIATTIAGFDEQESDLLRRAIGKKKADEMADLKSGFIDGCLRIGKVNKEQAEQLFGWIQESQKYSFNKCLGLSTIVETKGGYKTLEEIKVGDRILSLNNEYVEVLNKYNNGNKELYEITLESGKTIECTLDHQFLCEDYIKRSLQNIIANDHKVICQDD